MDDSFQTAMQGVDDHTAEVRKSVNIVLSAADTRADSLAEKASEALQSALSGYAGSHELRESRVRRLSLHHGDHNRPGAVTRTGNPGRLIP